MDWGPAVGEAATLAADSPGAGPGRRAAADSVAAGPGSADKKDSRQPASGDARITARPFVAEAVRGHLLERAGDTVEARESYVRAARRTASVPEQRYLALRAARLRQLAPPADPAG